MSRLHSQTILLFIAVIFMASCAVVPVKRITKVPVAKGSVPANPLQKAGWQLTFHDEFNNSILDRNKWNTRFYWSDGTEHHGRYMPENPKEYYRDDFFEFTDSTIKLKSDTLKMKVHAREIKYSCSMIDCSKSFEQQYGYFEIRSRNPTSPGFWPAFWLVSTYSWPPEIDMYEFYTSRPRQWTNTVHYLNNSKHEMEGRIYRMPDASAGFHIYAVEWNEKEVKFFLDNQLVRTTSTGINTFTFPMHIIINIAMENPHSKKTKMKKATFPNYLEVDYVRTYRKLLP
ncbi:MAG TPA: glycoside hydrolase family 16 protein [Chitinophagales bacterium]|nr:glycoside hydrolase family 16 protein [Chitinophagales bacterium]